MLAIAVDSSSSFYAAIDSWISNLMKKDKLLPFSSFAIIHVKCTEEIPTAEPANECVIITGSQHC